MVDVMVDFYGGDTVENGSRGCVEGWFAGGEPGGINELGSVPTKSAPDTASRYRTGRSVAQIGRWSLAAASSAAPVARTAIPRTKMWSSVNPIDSN